jgi:hypothetical protein
MSEPSFLLPPKAHKRHSILFRVRGANMANESVSPSLPENPDPQEKSSSGDDITPSQEQQPLPDRLPQSLIEWLARINRRYLALNHEDTNHSINGTEY